ncbi:MAG: hypothetical protein H7Z74_06055 [Anaerolineae bacterium]|nr:hypothetical protein [Gemmatimonadaceae bacterium]
MLLLNLNRLLFGTTYQARVTDLGSKVGAAEQPVLDFRVTAAELREWMLSDSETFSPSGGGRGLPLRVLLAKRAHGEFFSNRPGFVIWMIPKEPDVSKYLSVAQSWANDADLVLGAIADDTTLAIIGRERRVSKAILPPLRVETIHTIAGSGTDHLAQSYERTYLFSGRYDNRNDWAPIYLSSVLIDDEYGSLLNVTDQLLKSWSEHGTVHYVNFPYPAPERYPFNVPLHEKLQAQTVTFNWNTRGAGYVSEENGYRVYALNRTGALPVSYFAGDEQAKNEDVNNAEEVAYDYFAGLNDPNLARVVQYAALYQLFREFGVGIPKTVEDPKDPYAELREEAERMLASLASVPDSALTGARGSSPAYVEFVAGVRAIRAVQGVAGERAVPLLAARLSRARPSIEQLEKEAASATLLQIADSLKFDISKEDRISGTITRNVRPIQRALQLTLQALLPTEATNSARKTFVSASNRPADTWIRTASIVQSTSAELRWIGGHNLDAAVTRLRASANIAKGEVQVITKDGRTIILANEADIARLSSNVREISRVAGESNGGARISAMMAELRELPIRPRLEVISSPSRLVSSSSPVDRTLLGFERVHRGLSDAELSAASIMKTRGRPFTSIQRLENGSFELILGDPPRLVRAGNTASALDLVVHETKAIQGRALQLQLTGFTERDAGAFTRNVEFEYRKAGRSQQRVRSAVREGEQDRTGAAKILTGEVDFAKARVRPVELVEVKTASGVMKQAYKLEVELPRLVATEQPFLLRIWIFLTEGVGRPSMEAVQNAVRQALASMRGSVTADGAALEIQRELRRAFGDAVEMRTHVDDMLIVQLRGIDGVGAD